MYVSPKNIEAIDNFIQSFPSDMSLPGDDVQRGGLLRAVGDPETPSLPSLPFVPRQSTKKLRRTGALPKIPATPVGSDVAARLMRLLDGTLSKVCYVIT